ncbi:MAG: DNA alkylation repair protein [Gemmataceae bacterium]
MTRRPTPSVRALAAEIRDGVCAARDRTVPTLRLLRRDATRRVETLRPAVVFRLAHALLADTSLPHWLVYELLHHHAGAMTSITVAQLRRLGKGAADWGSVDAFACYLSGPAWRDGRIDDAAIHRWAASADRWWRRVAVVSSVPLNNSARGGSGDAARTLAVCDLVKQDRDDMVVKAVSWALRELAKKDPAVVQAYLHANREVLAARVVREVRNKLETGLKAPRRRSGRRNGSASA